MSGNLSNHLVVRNTLKAALLLFVLVLLVLNVSAAPTDFDDCGIRLQSVLSDQELLVGCHE